LEALERIKEELYQIIIEAGGSPNFDFISRRARMKLEEVVDLEKRTEDG